MFNWINPYGGSGAYVDAENKSASDIAAGLLSAVHLWHPSNRIEFLTCPTIEQVQAQLSILLGRCRKANKDLGRDLSIPFISVVDPLSGVPSEEHSSHIKEEHGTTDRGHGGRDEANLWCKWIKWFNTQIIDLPYISVFVNHVKTRQKEQGPRMVEDKYNPGGIAQNFAATLGLRCSASKRQQHSESVQGNTYQEIWIECSKNSHGPTGLRTMVRKYVKRQTGGQSLIWWDWSRNTAETLGAFGPRHESRDVCSVVRESGESYWCKDLGISDKDAVGPSELGDLIHKNEKIMEQLAEVFCWRKIKTFLPLSDEEYKTLSSQAEEAKQAIMASRNMPEPEEAKDEA
jgi:hypothetical protein